MTGVELAKADDSPRDRMREVEPGCDVVTANCTAGRASCSMSSSLPDGTLAKSLACTFVNVDDSLRR